MDPCPGTVGQPNCQPSLAGYVRCGWLLHLDNRAEPSG